MNSLMEDCKDANRLHFGCRLESLRPNAFLSLDRPVLLSPYWIFASEAVSVGVKARW
jgi:hypothetical protein